MHTFSHRLLRRLLVAAVVAPSISAVLIAQGPPPGQQGQQRPAPGPIRRLPDGKPDLSGFYNAAGRGANYGLEKHERWSFMPAGDGVVIDPPDGKLPMQDWAKKELAERQKPERGYDDTTAHCIQAAGPFRSFYVPSPFHILQPEGYLVVLFERMSWRHIPISNRPHLPDTMRFWQGNSRGRWEGDTLVVDTKNLNGKTWLNEAGELMSHEATVVERFIPVNADTIRYQATVTDPKVYTRPFTIEVMFNRQADGELLEVACLEDDQDLQHLKDIKEAAGAAGKKEN